MINDGDKVIRDHIGSMEAGSENIVFDKEAAWGRLSERMAPMAVTVVFKFPYKWVAAAAILLLITSAIMFIKRPEEKNVASIDKKTIPISLPVERSVIPKQHQEAFTVINTMPAHKNNSKKEGPKVNIIAIPATEKAAVKDLIVSVAPVEEKKVVVAATAKMKVVHINELMDEEQIEQRMKNSHYAGGRSFSLFKPAMEAGYTEEPENTKPRNPFKISLSTQN